MIIRYDDITLRAIERSDLELLREMMNDPIIENMTGGMTFPISSEEQLNWYANFKNNSNQLRLIIDTKEHGAIGAVILTDIDYRNQTAEFHSKIATSKELRGKGYGTKATMALIDYAFMQLNLNCIYSHIISYNLASQRVKEKCGFKKDGVFRERVFKNGKYNDITVWSVTRSDYLELKSQLEEKTNVESRTQRKIAEIH